MWDNKVRERNIRYHRILIIAFISFLSISFFAPTSSAEEYTFDISEIEKKPYHIGGYAEFMPAILGLNRDASLYKLRFYNRDEGQTIEEYNLKLQIEGSLEYGISHIYVKTNTD